MLLRARRERPCRHAAEQRDELAPFQLIDPHSAAPSQSDSIAEWRASGQGFAALRDFDLVFVRLGSDSVIWRLSPRCPVCPKADGSGDPETAPSAAKRLASEKP